MYCNPSFKFIRIIATEAVPPKRNQDNPFPLGYRVNVQDTINKQPSLSFMRLPHKHQTPATHSNSAENLFYEVQYSTLQQQAHEWI